jgi:uridylate kinase
MIDYSGAYIKHDELHNIEKQLSDYIKKGNGVAIIIDGGKIKFRHIQSNKHEQKPTIQK